MANEKTDRDAEGRKEIVEDLLKELKALDEEQVVCVVTSEEIGEDPDDPIRRTIDAAFGDFVEVKDIFGERYFFPTKGL